MKKKTKMTWLLTAALALTLPAFAGDGGSGSGKGCDDRGKVEDRGKDAGDDRGSGRSNDDAGKTDDRGGSTGPVSSDNRRLEDRNRQPLVATPAGLAIGAHGHAEIRERAGRQRFKVEFEASVPDGATFLVFSNGLPAGTVVMRLGEGELELDNNDGRTLPAGVSPVSSVRLVQVLDPNGGNTVLAEATF